MTLKELIKGISFEVLSGDINIEIENISWDSRKVKGKSLFIAVKNRNVDRHVFVDDAIKSGVIALVVEHEIDNIPQEVTVIKVEDSRRAMAIIAENFYGSPSQRIKLIGITGTNGKTSVSYFISSILQSMKVKTGIIGTIENSINGRRLSTEKLNPTTPDSIELQSSLSEMVSLGATHVVMEVTSSALSQDRVYGCDFDIGVFTNLTQDHLEEHGTMENYKNAKLKLFKMCRKGIVNIDDIVSTDIRNSGTCGFITYGIYNEADFKATNIKYFIDRVEFTLKYKDKLYNMKLDIPGKFSVYNALAAIATCCSLGFNLADIVKGVEKIHGVPGRFQAVSNSNGILAIVDYAHSPDSLKNILLSVKEISKGKVILVFGCGGNRDKTKRPIMGEIAGDLSNYCIITSDNPREEDPIDIIRDIEAGIKKTKCHYEKRVDRKGAIIKALEIAEEGDAVVIAGKGHENYQIIKNKTTYFDDAEIVRNVLGSEQLIHKVL